MRARLRALLNRFERQLWAHRSYKFVRRRWGELADLSALADVLATMRTGREIEPLELGFPSNKRIAVLAPHPDDEIIGPGGTLIGGIAQGSPTTVVYLTSGSEVAAEAQRREEEAREVAAGVGFDTHFLRLPRLQADNLATAADRVGQHLTELRPDIVFVPFLSDDHDEHRRTSEILAMACQQVTIPGRPEVWAYQVYGAVIPNVVVDITATAEAKAEAISLFRSQMEKRDWAHYALGLNAYNSRFLSGAKAAYAEMFFVLPLSDYADICRSYFARQSQVDLD